MATISLNQIAYDILQLNRAALKDTDTLEVREVKFWVMTLRVKLLKQRLDKPMASIDDHYVQDLGPVELEKVDSSILPNIPSDRYFLRTKVDLPDTIERSGHITTFTRVGPADRKEIKFQIVSHEHAIASGYGRFNNKFIYCFPIGPRLYFTSKDSSLLDLRYVDIRGVFQNPNEAKLFVDPAIIDIDDTDYPINMQLIDDIKTIIVQKELKFKNNQLVDKTTDEADDPEPTVKGG